MIIKLFTSAAAVVSLLATLPACGSQATDPAGAATGDSEPDAVTGDAEPGAGVDKNAPLDSDDLVSSATRVYAFQDGTDSTGGDSLRSYTVRVELQVAYDDGRATYARSHRSIHCYENVARPPQTDWQPAACSLKSPYMDLYRKGPYELDQIDGSISNTGSDGYDSLYGHWKSVASDGCYFGAALRSSSSSYMRVGLASKYFDVHDLWTSESASYNICESSP